MIIFLSGMLIIGSIHCSPLQSDVDLFPTPVNNEGLYRLPGESYPTFYDVRFFIDPDFPDYFYGNVSMRVIPNTGTNQLVMHAMGMQIDSVRVHRDLDETDLFDSFSISLDDTQLLRINLNEEAAAAQPLQVHIDYQSQYAANMFGVYVSSYTTSTGVTRNLVASQLQPTFARRAFPCYDEPALKAIFRFTIYAPAQFTTVLSNMPNRAQSVKPEVTGYVKHEFEDTVVQSSYLLAVLVSDFDFIANTQEPIYPSPFRVYSRPGTQDTAAFALDFGQKNLLELELYTEMPYAYPKMDKVAVPDFAAGAMENWGLVIYREARLLVQDGVTTTATRESTATIICHENMHQWFGNEVSPLWWSFTWLNEGFANFFQNFATDLVMPSWRMMEQYVVVMQNVFQADAVLGVNPMTAEVFSPSEVLGNFNAVAYQKSGSVIRMMHHFLTPEIFRQGLIIYLRDNARGAVSPAHLYAAMQQAANDNNYTLPNTFANIMNNWVNQGGFPVIDVEKQAASANSLSFKQYRYLTDTSQTSNTRWFVPLNWVLSTDPDFTDTSPQAWMGTGLLATHQNIPGLGEASWYIVNKQQTGYYRVNYDVDNWNALVNQLNSDDFEVIHLLNRAQLVDDAFNLARTNRMSYSILFNLIAYLERESDYIPWASASPGINYLNNVLQGSDVYPLFQNFILDLTAPVYERLGFIAAAAGEEHVAAFHRNIVLNLNCRYGNQHCLDTAQDLLQGFISNPSQALNPDIQIIVYCSGLRNGDPDDFDFMWNRYLNTGDHTEQSILLNALGCTSNREKLDQFMNQVISDSSQVREQDRHTILVATINSGPENANIAFEFIHEHFTQIKNRVQGLSGTTNILNALSGALSTEAHIQLLQEFIETYGSDFSAGEIAATNAALENLQATRSWVEGNMAEVDSWLRENAPGSASVAASSAILVMLLTAALFTSF